MDCATGEELRGLLGGEIEQAKFDGVVPVGGVHDAAPIGRPVGLIVVSRAVGELARLIRSYAGQEVERAGAAMPTLHRRPRQ
jgi:hypothetical protein